MIESGRRKQRRMAFAERTAMRDQQAVNQDGRLAAPRVGRFAALALAVAALAAPAGAASRVDASHEAFEKAGASLDPLAARELLSLDFVPEEGRTVIGLTATGPLLNHTAWQERGRDEERVVVELPGVDARDLQPLAEVGTEQVVLVRTKAEELSGRPSTRLEIVRKPGARHVVSVDPTNPNRLLITVPSGEAPAAGRAAAQEAPAAAEPARVLARRAEPAAPEAEPAAKPPAREPARPARPAVVEPEPEPEPVRTVDRRAPERAPSSLESLRPAEPVRPAAARPAPARPAATPVSLRDARVQRGDDGRTLLQIVGTGAIETAQPFVLENPARLVVDVPGGIWEGSRAVFPVRENGVYRVRVRQNQPLPEPVTRIVFDLESPGTPYQLVPGPDSLVIAVGRSEGAGSLPRMASAAPAGRASAAAPAPVAAAAAPTGLDALAQLGRPAGFDGRPQPAAPAAGAMLPPSQPMRETQSSSSALVQEPATGETRQMVGTTFETVQLGSEEPVYNGEPISVSLKDADLQDLFRMFKEISGLNIIVDSDLKGQTITIDVTEVPWDQVMAIVMKANNLGASLEGNVLRVAPLNKLAREEQQKKALQDARELAGEVVSIARTLSYASGQDAEALIRQSLSARGTAQLDRRTNTLIIKDIVPRVRDIEALLELIDKPTQQVMIEARIVETTKDFTKSVGIQWGLTYVADRAFGNSTNFSFPRSWGADYAVNLPVSGATSTLGLSFRNILNTFALDLAISAAEQRGRARIISAPRIMVQNNEEAEIESGVQIPIVNTTATEIEVTFVSASLKLAVQPQITADGTIIMDVDLENNAPVFIQTVGDNTSIATRRATTVVAVPDGGTTVIGGIYQVNEGVSQGRVPFLSRVPLLGWLFRNKQIDRTNDELIIFLTPSIQKN